MKLHELKPDHMIAQVWTGTAQSAVSHQGIRRSRTFENAYLEYSSALNLVRGTATKPWLLMDPLEDAPGRPMNEYFDNYRRTLGAALLFPETDRPLLCPRPGGEDPQDKRDAEIHQKHQYVRDMAEGKREDRRDEEIVPSSCAQCRRKEHRTHAKPEREEYDREQQHECD